MPAPPANASPVPYASDARRTTPTGRSLLRRLAPVMTSMAALIVSIVVFLGQRDMAQRAAIASEQTYADQISYWIMPEASNHHPKTLFVQNRGTAYISGVTVSLYAIDSSAGAPVPRRIGFGSIPPCTTLEAGLPGIIIKVSSSDIEFIDSAGLTWVRTSRGKLNVVSAARHDASPDAALVKQRLLLPVKACSGRRP